MSWTSNKRKEKKNNSSLEVMAGFTVLHFDQNLNCTYTFRLYCSKGWRDSIVTHIFVRISAIFELNCMNEIVNGVNSCCNNSSLNSKIEMLALVQQFCGNTSGNFSYPISKQ